MLDNIDIMSSYRYNVIKMGGQILKMRGQDTLLSEEVGHILSSFSHS